MTIFENFLLFGTIFFASLHWFLNNHKKAENFRMYFRSNTMFCDIRKLKRAKVLILLDAETQLTQKLHTSLFSLCQSRQCFK